MVQATTMMQPVQATSCVSGFSRINRVSVSERKKSRFSGKKRSRTLWIFVAILDRKVPAPSFSLPVYISSAAFCRLKWHYLGGFDDHLRKQSVEIGQGVAAKVFVGSILKHTC